MSAKSNPSNSTTILHISVVFVLFTLSDCATDHDPVVIILLSAFCINDFDMTCEINTKQREKRLIWNFTESVTLSNDNNSLCDKFERNSDGILTCSCDNNTKHLDF